MVNPNFKPGTWNLMTPNNNKIAIFCKWDDDETGCDLVVFERPIRINGMTCDPNRPEDLEIIRTTCDRQDEEEKSMDYSNNGLGRIQISFKDKEVDYLGFDS